LVIPPPTTKQDSLAQLVRSGRYEIVYADGGSQSGKTWLFTREGHRRNCLYAGCRGLVVRKHYADIRTKWWRQTYKPLVAEGIREGLVRLTESPFFVIEADEYDTAFFDKRSKFVHYRPRTAILNNLEFTW
jgi:hypothetical protein